MVKLESRFFRRAGALALGHQPVISGRWVNMTPLPSAQLLCHQRSLLMGSEADPRTTEEKLSWQ